MITTTCQLVPGVSILVKAAAVPVLVMAGLGLALLLLPADSQPAVPVAIAGALTACGALALARLLRPIMALERAMERLGAGDTAAEVPGIGRPDEFGRMARAAAAFRDTIAARQHAEERFNSLAANVPGLVYQRMQRPDGTVAYPYFSERLHEITGQDPAAIQADPQLVSRIIPADWRDAITKAYSRSARTMETATLEYEYLNAGGERRWAYGVARPRRLPDGTILWDGIMLDITERRELERRNAEIERQLAEARRLRAVGTLAGGMAHEINNALLPIFGNADLVLDGLPPDDPDRACLSDILASAQRVRSLVERLSALEGGDAAAQGRVVWPELVRDAVEARRADLPDGVLIDLVPVVGTGVACGDAGQLTQVFSTLLTNAVEAMGPEGGRIEVSVTDEILLRPPAPGLSPGAYTRLRVRDGGHGMDAETRQRVFEPFFTTKEVGLGQGLSLSTAYSIVRGQGGTILVDSEPGRGTTMDVLLPTVLQPDLVPPT
ncbi:MAG TPA: ATP-binding protein [Azospirillum sp.]|nr:ATP-binding protein [Azospirillum sp.]